MEDTRMKRPVGWDDKNVRKKPERRSGRDESCNGGTQRATTSVPTRLRAAAASWPSLSCYAVDPQAISSARAVP